MIDYHATLNSAQLEAVTTTEGPVLVIAGAGSGKTRTIIYRLAYLAEQGISPAALLLLTFTRKAAHEMLQRATALSAQGHGHSLMGVQGGTFHGFAYSVLRQYKPLWLGERAFSVMDAADSAAALRYCKDALKLGKGDRTFPKTQTIQGLISKSRNKEIPLEDILQREAFHLASHADALASLQMAYNSYRRAQGLLDYDDLLFEFEDLLNECGPAVAFLRQRIEYLMVDEYQDTNKVQARLVALLARRKDAGTSNVMAVGDDAQSIYAFRGADVRNIREFPQLFPGTRIVRLEENYRSSQPVLNIANTLLEDAPESFRKHLFTRRQGGAPVRCIQAASDRSQADLVVRRVRELLQEHMPHEIAVLFRAGFHSYQLEAALQRAGIAFRKYGGMRFTEAAHVKDVLSFARLGVNALDMPAFLRLTALHAGIGPKTAEKLYTIACTGDSVLLEKALGKYPDLLRDLRFVDSLRDAPLPPAGHMQALVEHYQPHLESLFADDWPRRRQGLDELAQMAASYQELDLFLADLTLESPTEDEDSADHITLSTVHSAKGLEWAAVSIIDLVEDRFPSRHAMVSAEDFEEERRLMYVACTRARQYLDLYAPSSVYQKGAFGSSFTTQSPFVRVLSACVEHWAEGPKGLARKGALGAQQPARLLPPAPAAHVSTPPPTEQVTASTALPLGYCCHKLFGRGKMVKFLPPDKYQVNFPGFGIKVILADFLTPE